MQNNQRPRQLHEIQINFDILKSLAQHGQLTGLQLEHTIDPTQSVVKYHLATDKLEYFGVVPQTPEMEKQFEAVMQEVYRKQVPDAN